MVKILLFTYLDWPYSRNSFINSEGTILIKTNFIDHLNLNILSDNTKYNINNCYALLTNLHNHFQKPNEIEYQIHKTFGYLNSCPSLFGYGLELNFTVMIKHLHKWNNFDDIILTNFDSYELLPNLNNENYLTVSARYKFCYGSEAYFIETMYSRLINIILLDDYNK